MENNGRVACYIDTVETVAKTFEWNYERSEENIIKIEMHGHHHCYPITFVWVEGDEMLRLICTFSLLVPEEKTASFQDLINLCNDMVWSGAFTWWQKHGCIAWRYGLTLNDVTGVTTGQVSQMIYAATTACDKLYPAMQLLLWENKSPQDAIRQALSPTGYGRA